MKQSDLRSWTIGIALFFGVGVLLSFFFFIQGLPIFGAVALVVVIGGTVDVIRTIMIVNKEQKQGKTEHSEDE